MAYEIVIPRLGWSMEEGTFIGWIRQSGEFVRRGDALFQMEGEKAIQDVEAVDEGILLVPANAPRPGTLLRVGSVVGYLLQSGEEVPVGVEARHEDTSTSLSQSATDSNWSTDEVPVGPISAPRSLEDKPIASPRARRIASELAIDWTGLPGSGADGRVRASDVWAAHASRPSAGARHPITRRRRAIARRMTTSHERTVPVTLTTKCDARQAVKLRDRLKSEAGASLVPSYQDIITKVVARVLAHHPWMASRWDGDAIVLPRENELHIGMAVDADQGLLVPVIRDVFGLSLVKLAAQSRSLTMKAREGTLNAQQTQGAVFTITNLGAFGIDAFTPVINYPEAAILGLGAIRREPVVGDDGQIVAQYRLSLSLTFDHRVVDGAPAARFLQAIVNALTDPSLQELG